MEGEIEMSGGGRSGGRNRVDGGRSGGREYNKLYRAKMSGQGREK